MTDSVPVGELAVSSDALMRRGELEREPKLCVYCGRKTRRKTRKTRVCGYHSDLPGLDPHTNIQAGRYDRSHK